MNIQQITYNVELLQALLWQHNNAAKLQSLLQEKSKWYKENVSNFWSDWVRDVFDLRTANKFGLQVWAILLGVPLFSIQEETDKPNFGFGIYNKNFNNGNFGFIGSSQNAISTENARTILQLRYFSITCRPSVIEINETLKMVFKDNKVYAITSLDMGSVIYVFEKNPGSVFLSLLRYYDVLPRPAAVGIDLLVVPRPAFGFGQYNKNFSNGSFGG